MYHPYFRGKQYELITIRENAGLLRDAGFVPIIEPVKESLSGLKKALNAMIAAPCGAVLVANPQYGDLAKKPNAIQELFRRELTLQNVVSAGIILTPTMGVGDAMALVMAYQEHPITIIHAGFTQGAELAREITNIDIQRHVFFEDYCGKLYRRKFRGTERILMRDGFTRRSNKNHPPIESFSDLHITFEEEGMNGFGDFLIVGDEYSHTGGPAYAVAIHLTFINPDQDEEMFIHHFVSDRSSDPTDPAGKFREALDKLFEEIEKPGTHIAPTEAVAEFMRLHAEGHFPGLGYVKKLSMQHHMETLALFFEQ